MRASVGCAYDDIMKTSRFRVVPLPTEVAARACHAAKAGASDHAMLTADSPIGYPCRHCLRWAQPGERVVLFPYASIAPGRPYSESGPIFIHAQPCEPYATTDEYPAEFRRNRVLRAYNAIDEMIDAEVIVGDNIVPVIEKLLSNPDAAFRQARSVSRDCYTMRLGRL